MIHELVKPDNPILFEKLEKFDFAEPPTDPIQLAKDLAETMILNEGLGLACNQIGLPYRAFAMMANPIIVCFNPFIIDQSAETIKLDEGCLTWPGVFLEIERPRRIKTRYTEPNGNIVTKEFHDLSARIFQHEYCHLEGNIFSDYVSDLKLIIAINKAKKHYGLKYKLSDFRQKTES